MKMELTSRDIYNERLAASVIRGLAKRNIEGFYCAYSSLALDMAKSFIKPGASVCSGGSKTIREIGLYDYLTSGGDFTYYNSSAAKTQEERQMIMRQAFSADVYFMSTNAITKDGILYNVDGNSNRVAALCFGPQEVVIIAGMNKVVNDLEEADKRVHREAAPINCVQLSKETPCGKTGVCANCLSENTICCQCVATRYSRHTGRIKVILVGENLGF